MSATTILTRIRARLHERRMMQRYRRGQVSADELDRWLWERGRWL